MIVNTLSIINNNISIIIALFRYFFKSKTINFILEYFLSKIMNDELIL